MFAIITTWILNAQLVVNFTHRRVIIIRVVARIILAWLLRSCQILTRLDFLHLLTQLGDSLREVSLNSVTLEIQKLGYNATDPHMDGYYQWSQKQKLYQILWETQTQLRKCSAFSVEDEWLNDHNEQVIIDKLKGN